MLQNQLKKQGLLDTLGGILSFGCAIHCLLVPVLTVFWPVLGASFFADASFHFTLLYFVVPTALISLFLGCRRHKDFKVLFWGILGLTILTVLTFLEEEECAHCVAEAGLSSLAFWTWSGDVLMQKGGMILGSVLLCFSHWLNFRACRSDKCSH